MDPARVKLRTPLVKPVMTLAFQLAVLLRHLSEQQASKKPNYDDDDDDDDDNDVGVY